MLHLQHFYRFSSPFAVVLVVPYCDPSDSSPFVRHCRHLRSALHPRPQPPIICQPLSHHRVRGASSSFHIELQSVRSLSIPGHYSLAQWLPCRSYIGAVGPLRLMAYQSGDQPSSYRTIPGRNVTKKWKNADTVDYDGYGYGDEEYDEPQYPAHDPRGPAWSETQPRSSPTGQSYASNRGVDPWPARDAGRASSERSAGRSSLDQRGLGRPSGDYDDDRRIFAQEPYDTSAQRATHHEPRTYDEPQNPEPLYPSNRAPPPLQVQTDSRSSSRGRGPFSASAGYHAPDRRMNQYPEPWQAPHSAGPASGARRSQSSGRPGPGEVFMRQESPVRPGSRGVQGSSPARFERPPRKSSLSQQHPPYDTSVPAASEATPLPAASSSHGVEGKPLPFVRPIDIWNRHKEEMSDRSSQESARPSIDPASDRLLPSTDDRREVSTTEHTSEHGAARGNTTSADVSMPKLPLSTVVERKSEYGLENMLQGRSPRSLSAHSRVTSPVTSPTARESEPQSAASDYSKPDMTSNASVYSQPSVRSQMPFQHEPSPTQYEAPLPQPLPLVRTTSGFGEDFFDHARMTPNVAAAPPPIPSLPSHPNLERSLF